MSQPNTINPYSIIGQQVQAGLDAIIAVLPAQPTIDDLVTAVYDYVKPIYYPTASPQVTIELKSVAYNVINSYRNNLVLNGNVMYNESQAPFIKMLIGPNMTANLAPDSFADRVSDIEDNIGTSELTINDQTALFLATTTGSNAQRYWRAQLDAQNPTWGAFFSTNAGQNYMNTLLWSVAAMNGALAGYGATPTGMVEPTTAMVTTKMVSALIGALTATAGKLVFNWIPRITKPLELNKGQLASLTTNPNTQPHHGDPISATCWLKSALMCLTHAAHCSQYSCAHEIGRFTVVCIELG